MTSTSTIIRHRNDEAGPSFLNAIRLNSVNMAIWKRSPIPICQEAVEALLTVPYAVALDENPADHERLGNRVAGLVGRNASLSSARALAEDIWQLASLFRNLADTNHARVRLERIEDDGCLLFHADTLRLRMLCTYAGPGTEWVENENARFDQLGLQGRSVEAANRAIVIDESQIRHLPPWHVAVFSGRLREDTPPLIHRSAPVPTEKEHRIRLCIDFPDACGC